MKTTRIALFALLLLGAAGPALGISFNPSSGDTSVNLGFFYDELAPHGTWVETPRHGWAWTPLGVADTWRPYQDGRWAWTDQGWTWLSDEPFGWATYHYGRWYDDPAIGWTWVPGYEWAPSWVSWQESPDYIGWAPLPPSVRLVSGFNGSRIALAPDAYVFVPQRQFLAPNVVDFVVPAQRVRPIFRASRNVTAYRFAGGRVFASGVPIERVGRFRTVPRLRLVDFGPDVRVRRARLIDGDRIAVFRPQVRRVRVAAPAFRPLARRAVVPFDEFRKLRGRSALARSRTGIPPGLTRIPPGHTRIPPGLARVPRGHLKTPPGHLRDDRVRAVREVRQPRVKELTRPRGRSILRQDDIRPERRLKQARREVRPQRIREAPRVKRERPAVREKHLRDAPRIRHESRGPSMKRHHARSAPQRIHARPAARQRQDARPGRQHGRGGRQRSR